MNPCPCGFYGDPVQECTCSNAMVSRYQKRISGSVEHNSLTAKELEVAYAGESDQIFDVSTLMLYINYGRKRHRTGSFADTLCLSAR